MNQRLYKKKTGNKRLTKAMKSARMKCIVCGGMVDVQQLDDVNSYL